MATYNIRFDNINDGVNAWDMRYPVLTDLIRFHNFDIFGTQEGLFHQLQDIGAALPEYRYIGVGRADGAKEGEFQAIFYRKDRLALLDQGNFWFSLTPEVPSLGWDADLPRLCSWGQFREQETGFSFYFFNLHLEFIGKQARRESVKLVLQKIAQLAGGSPVVLTGDFNFGQQDLEYAVMSTSGIVKDAYELAEVRYAPKGTFNAFGESITKELSQLRIDHIWLSSDFEVARYGILTDSYGDGRYPSDHFPVVADVKFA